MTAQVHTNSKHRIIEIIDRYTMLIEELGIVSSIKER